MLSFLVEWKDHKSEDISNYIFSHVWFKLNSVSYCNNPIKKPGLSSRLLSIFFEK